MVQLHAGCYERFVFGIDVQQDAEGNVQLQRARCQAAHRHAVKCIGSCGSYVATGGADDQLHLFDVKRNSDLGFLVNPAEGAVPCLAFVRPAGAWQPTHLLTGTVTGALCIWKAGGGWELGKQIKGHAGELTGVAAHPTGALAVSVSRDTQMRVWDLQKACSAYQAPLGAEGVHIGFLPGGQHFYIGTRKTFTLHSIKGQTLSSLQHSSQVMAAAPLDTHTLLTATDSGTVHAWDLRRPDTPAGTVDNAHAARIRALCVVPGKADDGSPGTRMVASASSDGVVKVWDSDAVVRSSKGSTAQAAASLEMRARFTCMCVWNEKPGTVMDLGAHDEDGHVQDSRTNSSIASAGKHGKWAGREHDAHHEQDADPERPHACTTSRPGKGLTPHGMEGGTGANKAQRGAKRQGARKPGGRAREPGSVACLQEDDARAEVQMQNGDDRSKLRTDDGCRALPESPIKATRVQGEVDNDEPGRVRREQGQRAAGSKVKKRPVKTGDGRTSKCIAVQDKGKVHMAESQSHELTVDGQGVPSIQPIGSRSKKRQRRQKQQSV